MRTKVAMSPEEAYGILMGRLTDLETLTGLSLGSGSAPSSSLEPFLKALPDYYLGMTFWSRAICAVRFFPLFSGHDFVHIYYRDPDQPGIVGIRALACRICSRVQGHQFFRGFLPNTVYGSSPSNGRSLPTIRAERR